MSIPRQHLTQADFNSTVLALLLPAYLGSATEALYMEESHCSVLRISRFRSIFNLITYLILFLSSYRASSNALGSRGPCTSQMKSSWNHISYSNTAPDGRFHTTAFLLASFRIFSLILSTNIEYHFPTARPVSPPRSSSFHSNHGYIWRHSSQSHVVNYGLSSRSVTSFLLRK